MGQAPPLRNFDKVTLLLDGNHTPIMDKKEVKQHNKQAKINKTQRAQRNLTRSRDVNKWKDLDASNSYYSHKLEAPAISHLVVVQMNGRVVFISPGTPAAAHDITILKKNRCVIWTSKTIILSGVIAIL